MRGAARAWVLVVFTIGCSASSSGTDTAGEEGGGDGSAAPDGGGGGGAAASLRACAGESFTPAPRTSWRHPFLSRVVTAAGAPNHSAQDVVSPAARSAKLAARLTYGAISKDLEDEDVAAFLDECDGWHSLGVYTTDEDGRIAAALDADLPPGLYEARFEVLGDQSTTGAFLWILPAGTHLVVTDIDGTLTTADSELYKQILDGSYVPEAYQGAVDLTRAHGEAGWIVFYLTGRPYLLTAKSRAWLHDLGFAAGPVRVTDSPFDALPTESAVGAFKLAQLEHLLDDGYAIDFAYGNTTTDIHAYLDAGMAADDIWIIGDHAGEEGTRAADGTWEPRAAEVASLPPPAQPF
jgi:hypothetical protein